MKDAVRSNAYLAMEERITREDALLKIDGLLEALTAQDTERYIAGSIELLLDLTNSLGSVEAEWSAMMEQAANMLTLVVDEVAPGKFQAKVPHRAQGYDGGTRDPFGYYVFNDYHQACQAALVGADEQAKLIDDIEDARRAFEESCEEGGDE